MLYVKTTSTSVAPGIYAIDVAAKPPGKTFIISAAVNATDMPSAFIEAVAGMGFKQVDQKTYTHSDGTKIIDLHFQKAGTDIFEGWTTAEKDANLDAMTKVFGGLNIKFTPRVMSLAEAFR